MPAADLPVREVSRVQIQQDEVLTGEAVALDVQPVGYFLRALGALIDVLVGVAVFVLFALVASWMSGQNILTTEVFPILSIVMIVLVTVIIPTTVETATRGRSLGKLVVGARIVRTDGGASGFRQAFIRAFVGVIEIWLTLGAVAALVGAFTPRAQRLGDLLAGTYSERTRAPALPPPAPPAPPVLAAWAVTADVARLPDRLARRVSQFVRQAEHMEPSARARIAASLSAEAAPFVAPLPAVDSETLLRGIMAVRRDRELRALLGEADRVGALTAVDEGPRGFPRQAPRQ